MHGLVFAALLVAVPAPPMPGAPVAEGARIRFTGVVVASGPGAPRPGSSSIPGVVLWADDRFTVRDVEGGGVFTLPQPGRSLEGRLVSIEGGVMNVLLKDGTEVARVPLRAVERLQVAKGRDRGRGAINGAVAGGLLGMFYGYLASSEFCDGDFFRCDGAQVTLIVGAMGGALGAGVGAVIGTRRWEPLEPGRMALTLGPRADGVGFTLRIGLPRR